MSMHRIAVVPDVRVDRDVEHLFHLDEVLGIEGDFGLREQVLPVLG